MGSTTPTRWEYVVKFIDGTDEEVYALARAGSGGVNAYRAGEPPIWIPNHRIHSVTKRERVAFGLKIVEDPTVPPDEIHLRTDNGETRLKVQP